MPQHYLCVLLLAFTLLGVLVSVEGREVTDAPHVSSAAPLHVGIITIPLYGHIKPLQVVGEEFLRRGHHVTYFMEDRNKNRWCDAMLESSGHVNCVVLPSRGVFSDVFFENITEESSILKAFYLLLEESLRHHELHLGEYLSAVKKVHAVRPIDILLRDSTTFLGGSVSLALGMPSALLFPFTMLITTGVGSQIPSMGTGLPVKMNIWQHTLNYAIKSAVLTLPHNDVVERINAVRSAHNISTILFKQELSGIYETIIAPTVWGFDIPYELCPNIHPVGFLAFSDDRTPLMEKHLEAFLDGCTNGAVYVNFGTLQVLRERHLDRVARALHRIPQCIVWKMLERQRKVVMEKYFASMENRTYIRTYFASPVKVMKHRNVIAFVSHCGDTSVHESMDARLPVVGIPFSSDQPDVCQRVEESGVGKSVGYKENFTPDDLERAILWVAANSETVKANIDRLLRISNFLGGAKKAVDILELRSRGGLLGSRGTVEQCVMYKNAVEVAPFRAGQLDVLVVWLFVLVPLWLFLFGCMGSFCSYIKSLIFKRCCFAACRQKRRFKAIPRASQKEKP